MDYTMEELLPVVGKLTEKYTGFSSTSVTYETARQLMEAVLYCLREAEAEALKTGKNSVAAAQDTDLWLLYRQGYEVVLEKTARAKKVYEQIIANFRSFGNRCYEDTIIRGIPEFFVRYDARFRPQDHLLTLDYPILRPVGKRSGIDAVYFYLSCVLLEQRFLGRLPEPYGKAVLEHFHGDYEELILNVASVILRNLVVHMMMGKKLSENAVTADDMERFCRRVKNCDRPKLEDTISHQLERLTGGPEGDRALYSYLSSDRKDFVAELKNAAECGYMDRMIVY
ncbi:MULTISPECIES: DUF6179 domain-containing protein [Hungatella]|uniref:DUF6179 domain-containing protein n=1 Tax=Hungatella TaxID=1649459 RepID=UPI0025904763|nr:MULTISPECIES: DUF6179 domain-containing protein [Hungatella]MCI6454304.1 DUF6179 domain-containing protein [Hungatella sp.]